MNSPALRVFISYARRDGDAFAQELLAGLEVAGFDAFLDKQDIAAGEDWEARLSGLIQEADTVIFVVTPASVASERCAQEVALAQRASKRIIPVVAITVPDADAPPALARLNYIYFSEGHSFARALGQLAQALRVDVDWIREHTRLGDAAVRWRDRDKSELLLLRGAELSAAQHWLAAWKAGAPEPTDLHRLYIQEAEAAEQRRVNAERQQLAALAEAQAARELAFKRLSRRTTLGLIGLGGLVAVSAGAAAVALNEREARRLAEQRSIEAIIAREAARTDLAGQLTLVTNAARQGRSAPDEPSAYAAALLDEIDDRDVSLLQATERVNQRGGLKRPAQVRSDLNGGLYLGRPSPLARRAFVVSVSQVGERVFTASAQDAARWAAKLEAMAFSVSRLADPDLQTLLAALQAPPDRPMLTLLYFAGGGVNLDREDYILAAGSRFATREEVETTALNLAVVKAALGASQASVLILDTSFADFRLAAL